MKIRTLNYMYISFHEVSQNSFAYTLKSVLLHYENVLWICFAYVMVKAQAILGLTGLDAWSMIKARNIFSILFNAQYYRSDI